MITVYLQILFSELLPTILNFNLIANGHEPFIITVKINTKMCNHIVQNAK